MANPQAWARMQDRLHSAITQVYHELADELGEDHEDFELYKGMLQGFLLVTEWHGLDGTRAVNMQASSDARLWDVEGWVAYVGRDLQAQHNAEHIAMMMEDIENES